MDSVATTTDTWRTTVTGARGYAAVAHPLTTHLMRNKSFDKAINGRPTRRGAPPH